MKVIILAAGQGTRLRPLTDDRPKCMVEIKGKSIIERQLETMYQCGIAEENIYIVTGYRGDVLRDKFKERKFHFIQNENFETTNMVCSLMCAEHILEENDDIIISYGDIIYESCVFEAILKAENDISVIVDDGWYAYWAQRCENPLDDAETLLYDAQDNLIEIGQKTSDLARVQSQYIGLMRYRGEGVKKVLDIARQAKKRSEQGVPLWRTNRNYHKMYMTDLLQGLIDENNELKAVHINRGWFEVDDCEDLRVVESKIRE